MRILVSMVLIASLFFALGLEGKAAQVPEQRPKVAEQEAAPFKVLPVTMTVVAGIKKIELYSDQACTIPLTALVFTNVPQGETVTKTFYVKNEAKIPTGITLNIVGDVPGALALKPYRYEAIQPNQVMTIEAEFLASPVVAPGVYTVTVEVVDANP